MRGIEREQSALYEIASGIITYFLHGSSRGLIRMMVVRERRDEKLRKGTAIENKQDEREEERKIKNG